MTIANCGNERLPPCPIRRRLMFKVVGYVHYDDAFFEEQRSF
jgi:hypothetical protein